MKKIEQTLLFLTLFFLPTQLGKHFWPEFSYVYSLKIDYLSPTVYFWDLLALALILVFIAQRRVVNRFALNIFLLFTLFCTLSLLPVLNFGINFGAGLVRLEQYLIAGLFGVYIASLDIKKYRTVFFWPILLSIFFESLLAVGQFLSGHTLGFWIFGERTFSISTPAIAKFDFGGIELLRPYGTFSHPNVLAGFMVIGVLLLFLIKQKVNYIYGLIMAVILLTASRVAMTAGFFASIIFLPRKYLIWLLCLAVIFSPFLYTRFSSLFNFDNLTLLRREGLAQVALNLFSKNAILGVGLNNFIPAAADKLLVGPSRFLQPVHNIFLLQLSETGILGLLGLLVLIGVPVWLLFKSKAKVLLIIWIVIVFLGMFDHYFLTLPQGYRLLFLVWGLSFGLFNQKSHFRT